MSTAADSRAGRRGPRPRFTPDEIADAALALVDRDGVARLTMRQLAGELGLTPMSLYSAFRDKGAVLAAVAARALAAGLPASPETGDWPVDLAEAMRALRENLQRHPGVVELLLVHDTTGPALDPVREHLLGILRRGGLSAPACVEALSAVYSYTIGFTVTERLRQHGHDPDEVTRLQALPAADFPHLRALARTYTNRASERAFESGLRHLINGLVLDLESQ